MMGAEDTIVFSSSVVDHIIFQTLRPNWCYHLRYKISSITWNVFEETILESKVRLPTKNIEVVIVSDNG